MAKDKQSTWGGRFSEKPADLMVRFSESVSFDKRLAAFDIQCSKAHSAMLAHVGIITEEERNAIHTGLDNILEEIKAGKFTWDINLEDVHMNIESVLTSRVPAAAKLHTARSRNDQVATDMRLFFKWACADISDRLGHLLNNLVEKASELRDIYIPGYTHLQRAQPVSFAHHLLAYVEMFSRDLERFSEVSQRANFCPLGSGAIAGTTLPIDREFTAKELGFVDEEGKPRVTTNSMDAVADRDVFIEFASACALCGAHFSRLAEDVILWNSSEFGYVNLPDTFTTGSSLMPQKKNPDSMELVRGKSAKLMGNLQTLLTMVKGLPLTYNRDLQEDKPPVFDSYDQTAISLDVIAGTIEGMTARKDKCAQAVSDPLLLATDVVDYLVTRGVPFRDAHHVVGHLVAAAERLNLPLNKLPYEEAHEAHALLSQDWLSVFDIETAMSKRDKTGMPGPNRVDAEIERWRRFLRK